MVHYDTIYNNNRLRESLQEWLCEGDYNFAATANFNCHTNLATAKKLLETWQRNVNRKVLGRKWKQAPEDDRLFFIAIPEHQASNLHFHMVLRAPVNSLKAQRIAAKMWRFVVPSGGMWISALDNISDLSRVAAYATKDLWMGKGIEGFIVSE